MLGQVEADRKITRVAISRGGPKLTHVLFANDLVLFVGSQWREANTIMLVLKVYEEALDQKLNLDKSTLFFSHSTPKRHCEAPPSNTLGLC